MNSDNSNTIYVYKAYMLYITKYRYFICNGYGDE